MLPSNAKRLEPAFFLNAHDYHFEAARDGIYWFISEADFEENEKRVSLQKYIVPLSLYKHLIRRARSFLFNVRKVLLIFYVKRGEFPPRVQHVTAIEYFTWWGWTDDGT